jgi:hypothetical protein
LFFFKENVAIATIENQSTIKQKRVGGSCQISNKSKARQKKTFEQVKQWRV